MGYEKNNGMGLCDFGYCDEGEDGVLGAAFRRRVSRRRSILRRKRGAAPSATAGQTSTITVNMTIPPGAAVWPRQGVPWVAFDYRPPGRSWRQQTGGPVSSDGTLVITNPFPYGEYRVYATGWCGGTKVESPKVSLRIRTQNPVINVSAPVCR